MKQEKERASQCIKWYFLSDPCGTHSGKNLALRTRCLGYNPYLNDPWNMQSWPIYMHFLILNNVSSCYEWRNWDRAFQSVWDHKAGKWLNWNSSTVYSKVCIFPSSQKKWGNSCKTFWDFTCLSFIRASRRHDTPGSETKGFFHL